MDSGTCWWDRSYRTSSILPRCHSRNRTGLWMFPRPSGKGRDPRDSPRPHRPVTRGRGCRSRSSRPHDSKGGRNRGGWRQRGKQASQARKEVSSPSPRRAARPASRPARASTGTPRELHHRPPRMRRHLSYKRQPRKQLQVETTELQADREEERPKMQRQRGAAGRRPGSQGWPRSLSFWANAEDTNERVQI